MTNIWLSVVTYLNNAWGYKKLLGLQRTNYVTVKSVSVYAFLQGVMRWVSICYSSVFFTTSKMDRQLLRRGVCQRVSVMKTNNGVFVVFKTKHDLKYQFSGNIECVCFRYWDSLTNFLMWYLTIHLWRCKNTALMSLRC